MTMVLDNQQAHATRLLTHRGVAYPWQCDHNGHLNVAWYVARFDEATWGLFDDLGITSDHRNRAGVAMVAVEQRLCYLKELFAGDTFTITSSVLAVGKTSLRFEHAMRRTAGAVLASTATMTGVYLDRQSRRARPFPPDLRMALERFSPEPASS